MSQNQSDGLVAAAVAAGGGTHMEITFMRGSGSGRVRGRGREAKQTHRAREHFNKHISMYISVVQVCKQLINKSRNFTMAKNEREKKKKTAGDN